MVLPWAFCGIILSKFMKYTKKFRGAIGTETVYSFGDMRAMFASFLEYWKLSGQILEPRIRLAEVHRDSK